MSENTKQNSGIKKISIAALIACILSVPLTVIIAVVAIINSDGAFPNFWEVIFIILVPIFAITFSIYALKKNQLGVPIATIMVGGVACFAIVATALIPTFVNFIEMIVDEKIEEVEETINFYFPNSFSSFNYQQGGSFGPEKDNIKVKMVIEVVFEDPAEIHNFEVLVHGSQKWETGFNELGFAMVPNGAEALLQTGSDFLVYNLDTDEYNIFPESGATYECLFVAYDEIYTSLTIYRFTITV